MITTLDPSAEREAGRTAYHAGEAYRWSHARSLAWKEGWLDAAHATALERLTERAKAGSPPMMKPCTCGRWEAE